MHKTIKTSEVVFREDLYPRLEHNQQKAQEYSANLEQLPPIEVNQHNELIDGKHRWIAHQLAKAEEIAVIVTETTSDEHFLELAILRNAAHGLQLSQADKKRMAIRFYALGDRTPERKKQLAQMLSVTVASVQGWVSDLDQAEREERNRKIVDLWFRCYTDAEIASEIEMTEQPVKEALSDISQTFEKNPKVTFSDDFAPPIYNVWSFGKKTNATEHFGNTEQRIVENLLWAYTQPGDIVVDPFAGGGSTLDVCRARGRRCWLSDRKPKPGLEDKVRTLDVCTELPVLNKRWSDVSLVYLDPPYWRQAEGQYSDDAEDLANMPLEKFTEELAGIVDGFSRKLTRPGAVIALIIQPTQWKSEPKGAFTDHVSDLVRKANPKRLVLENRVSCPYATEQCTPQMVEWAKENRKFLVLSRELIIWRVL